MFKRISVIFVAILLLISVLGVTVYAANPEVAFNCSTVGSDAKGEPLVLYFKNSATGEEFSRNISTVGLNHFNDIPVGEYDVIKCVHAKNENVEYPIASMEKSFVVSETEATLYTFRVANSIETKEGAKEELSKAVRMDWLLLLACFLIVAFFIVWLIFAIMGRKNYFKKLIARFFFHLMFGFIGFVVGFFIVGGDMSQFMVCLLAAGFPFGCALAAYINYVRDMERGFYVVREGESMGVFCVRVLFILILCALIGMIAMPVVIVWDIVNIIKNKGANYEE